MAGLDQDYEIFGGSYEAADWSFNRMSGRSADTCKREIISVKTGDPIDPTDSIFSDVLDYEYNYFEAHPELFQYSHS